MNNQRIIVNITASANWRHRPVGIIRVERELIKQISRLHPTQIEPVLLDTNTGEWKLTGAKLFDEICADDWVHSVKPDEIPMSLQKKLVPFKPQVTDRFVSVGSDWSFEIPNKVEKLYGQNNVLISALYDLIPLILPEYTPGVEFYEQFQRHYRKVARIAQSVFSISEHSKKDLLNFWEQENLNGPLPRVEVIPLAGLARKKTLPELNAEESAQIANIRKDGDYVIYVSTLEPRKNHQLMLDIWRELHLERGRNCPRLIFVGMRGWGVDNMLHQMDQMNATRDGRILWLQGVKDDLLMHLYAHALFAVMPSHYEGWGLAATEAASFGKICVTANNSAIVEATGGLSPSHHPLDYPAWNLELRRLIDNSEHRKSLELKITEGFIQRTWDDFGSDFSKTLLS
ncbi:glycosyltransferase family 4 protein [Acidithiobacillus thiooxidans]|uniref:glycosyltransferase family 4 protein n=1 Tax=Acidithiobacillus TaxID=119977 RepID=UPI00187980C3|nr:MULTISPECIES: glycosyltransferase family 1 protein [Acidithiobacillus]MBE7565876.1 glycosyltransferase family 4 protein [Acidithiobacillus sp. HP-11]MBU2749423.1 glycosyltransferase family 4 protein [Acidithiobacillus thiooxidans]